MNASRQAELRLNGVVGRCGQRIFGRNQSMMQYSNLLSLVPLPYGVLVILIIAALGA